MSNGCLTTIPDTSVIEVQIISLREISTLHNLEMLYCYADVDLLKL